MSRDVTDDRDIAFGHSERWSVGSPFVSRSARCASGQFAVAHRFILAIGAHTTDDSPPARTNVGLCRALARSRGLCRAIAWRVELWRGFAATFVQWRCNSSPGTFVEENAGFRRFLFYGRLTRGATFGVSFTDGEAISPRGDMPKNRVRFFNKGASCRQSTPSLLISSRASSASRIVQR
jgi:hypothetical protein